MKPTKQQAISLHLAKWLGNEIIDSAHVLVFDESGNRRVFDPFCDSTEGRAQFAECVIKALSSRNCHILREANAVLVSNFTASPLSGFSRGAFDDGHDIVAATLEAIYYATDGKAEDLE